VKIDEQNIREGVAMQRKSPTGTSQSAFLQVMIYASPNPVLLGLSDLSGWKVMAIGEIGLSASMGR
jgi:hypothetical protein